MKRAVLFLSLILIAGLSSAQQNGCISGDCADGYGTYVWDNGDKYVGNWSASVMKGFGTYYFAIGDKYIGEWANGTFEGFGTYTYKDGRVDKGYWAAGVFKGATDPNQNVVNNTKSGCISGDCDNGYGTWVFESGEKFVGNWVNQKRNGFGTNYWVTGNWYRGEWIDDQRNGEGTYQFKNGDKYVGQWKNDKYDGEGTYTYINGTIEKGFWANGEFLGNKNTNVVSSTGCISGNCTDGYGTYVFKSGEKYVGNWVTDKRDGFGTNYFVTGEWYKGEWKQDIRHGQGTNFYSNGEKYDGNWVDGKKHGYGTYTYLDGRVETGMWDSNRYVGTGNNNYGCISGNCDNGYGVYTFDSGEKYVGDWINGKRNGNGINTWANGEQFDGGWKEDKRHGYGKQIYTDGEIKTGFWEEGTYIGTNVAKSGCISGDCQSGYGTYLSTNGDKYEGNFKNGTYEGQGNYDFAEGHRYVGEFKDGKFSGQGSYVMAKTGAKYIGAFANGTYNGIGTYYYEDGREESGIWKDGAYVGSAEKNLAKPEVSWLTPSYANSETDKAETGIKLCIKSKEELQNVQIFVNNELQANNAVRGFSVVTSSCDFTLDRTVKLKPGDNSIKVVVQNGGGKTESSIRTIKFNATSTTNQKRYALLIGNSDYLTSPLKNPANDAKAIATELKKLGFDVMMYTNLSQNDMKIHIREFGDKLAANKGVGLFFYAGHGMQVNGENYLIPVNAKIEKEQDVELESVNLKRLMGEMEYAQNDLNIVILDACRNNPFARSFRSGGNQGLASTLAPTGTFIAFATAPGSVASDGSGDNGLYTQELLKALRMQNMRIEDVFKEVRKNVYQISDKKQVPWENSSIFSDFFFNN
jgi:hypothetical protein